MNWSPSARTPVKIEPLDLFFLLRRYEEAELQLGKILILLIQIL